MDFFGKSRFLVPTLRVGTHVRPLCDPSLSAAWGLVATRSVANLRSHAERGNEREALKWRLLHPCGNGRLDRKTHASNRPCPGNV